MYLYLYFLMLAACKALAAPATSSRSQVSFNSTKNTANTTLPIQFTLYNVHLKAIPITPLPSIVSALPSDLPRPTPSQRTAITSLVPSNLSFFPPPSTSFAPLPISTIFATKISTAFETATVAPTLPSTTIITVVVTATATVTSSPSPSWDNRTQWVTPMQMTDLSAFNITYFPSGQHNLRLVAQIPAKDMSPTATFRHAFTPTHTPAPPTLLQLVYPAHSVNPGSTPVGGADFYATPLNLAGARNVTLEYSVFFPAAFNWVKGGKLPGLFGGHTGCSGGSSARDCFSTRLMWRPQGVGELYLYAPKGRQTTALCGDVDSVCDSTYGFSVGRGAFNFTAGDWTHLRQNVVLNTPGQNDGVFVLFVNGRPKINRTDIFYREAVQQAKKSKSILEILLVIGALSMTENALKEKGDLQPVEFVGLFFSTFFGGHGKQYATPKQQYTWFKDFTIIRHD